MAVIDHLGHNDSNNPALHVMLSVCIFKAAQPGALLAARRWVIFPCSALPCSLWEETLKDFCRQLTQFVSIFISRPAFTSSVSLHTHSHFSLFPSLSLSLFLSLSLSLSLFSLIVSHPVLGGLCVDWAQADTTWAKLKSGCFLSQPVSPTAV